MNTFKEINKIFPIKNNQDAFIDDKISSFDIEYEIDNIKPLNKECIFDLFSSFPKEDFCTLSIKVGDNTPISLNNKNTESDKFISDINNEISYLENEKIFLTFKVSKIKNSGPRHIYDYKSFCMFWENTSSTNILKLLNKDLSTSGSINYIFLEEGLEEFQTSNIYFGYKPKTSITEDYRCLFAKENCHFGNYEEFPFNPKCFNLQKSPSAHNAITQKFNLFKLLFCITSIFDITSINENNLYYKINGYKSFEGCINIDKISHTSANNYFQIFDWIYSSEGNISDKIGLARNILSIYLQESSIEIPAECYTSIQSGYKTYLQKNVSKYIEIRGKINDDLSWISQKSSEVIDKYLNNYEKSIFTFLSFFISVFVIRVLNSSKYENIFTKDATVLSLAFLALSLIFLLFSIWNLNKEQERIKRKYQNLKSRYKDLLIEKDINKILRDDEEFNFEMDFIRKRRNSYTILWIVTIIILSSSILYLSSYLNFQIIIESIKSSRLLDH